MRLLIFKVSSPHEYGALSFQDSGVSLKEVYKQMLDNEVTMIESHPEDDEEEVDHWQVSLERTIEVADEEQADLIIGVLSDVTDDDWCGDYDSRKHVDWLSLTV